MDGGNWGAINIHLFDAGFVISSLHSDLDKYHKYVADMILMTSRYYYLQLTM